MSAFSESANCWDVASVKQHCDGCHWLCDIDDCGEVLLVDVYREEADIGGMFVNDSCRLRS